MAKFCSKCGAQLADDAQFCPSCGTPAGEGAGQGAQSQQTENRQYQQTENQQYQQQTGSNTSDQFKEAMKSNDYTASFHPQDIANNKGMSVLSYLGILALIPFFSKRNSPYMRFHATQGMYLFLCDIAVSIVSSLLGLIRVHETYFGVTYYSYVPWPVRLIQWLLSAITLVYAIVGIVFAATGKARDLPLVCKMRKLGWFK